MFAPITRRIRLYLHPVKLGPTSNGSFLLDYLAPSISPLKDQSLRGHSPDVKTSHGITLFGLHRY